MLRFLFILFLSIAIVFVVLLIVANNTELVTINYIFDTIELTISSFIVIAFSSGFILALLLLSISYYSLKLKLGLLKRKLRKAEMYNRAALIEQQKVSISK